MVEDEQMNIKFFRLFTKDKNNKPTKDRTIVKKADTINTPFIDISSINKLKPIKILCIADAHGLLHHARDVLKNIPPQEYNCVISLGDNYIDDLNIIKECVPTNVYGILGNHDDYNALEKCNITNIHKKIINIDGVKIAGFQGSNKYKNVEYPSFTQEESILECNEIEPADILISHTGPYNLYNHDIAHTGLSGISNYIKKNNIILNIHGHMHDNMVKYSTNGTKVICVYGIAIVNTGDMSVNIIKSINDIFE